jgi:hypothetical protein
MIAAPHRKRGPGSTRLMGGLPLRVRPGVQAVVGSGRCGRLPFPHTYRLHARRVMILGPPWRPRGTEPPAR